MKNKTPRKIGMVELSYFVDMMKDYLDPQWKEHFWSQIHQNCPLLMQAIDARFRSKDGWGKITFSWNTPSPAFDPDLVKGSEEEPVGTGDQQISMNPYTRRVKRGADLLDEKAPGWRDKIDLATLDFSTGGILGQLFDGFDGYANGVRALFYIDMGKYEYDAGAWFDSLDHLTVVDHGFTIDDLRVEDDDRERTALQEAWIAELTKIEVTTKESSFPLQLEPEQESRI